MRPNTSTCLMWIWKKKKRKKKPGILTLLSLLLTVLREGWEREIYRQSLRVSRTPFFTGFQNTSFTHFFFSCAQLTTTTRYAFSIYSFGTVGNNRPPSIGNCSCAFCPRSSNFRSACSVNGWNVGGWTGFPHLSMALILAMVALGWSGPYQTPAVIVMISPSAVFRLLGTIVREHGLGESFALLPRSTCRKLRLNWIACYDGNKGSFILFSFFAFYADCAYIFQDGRFIIQFSQLFFS